MTAQEKILADIVAERKRQDAKWGAQHHLENEWCMILGEEFGEVCSAACDRWNFAAQRPGEHREKAQYRRELVQVAAVAVAAIEDLDSRT